MPRLRLRDESGTLRTIVRVRMRDEDSVLRTLQRIRARDTGATTRTVFGSFSATITPSPVDGYLAGTSTSSVTTASVTVAVSGGTAPYTYAWTQTGSSPYTWTINSPTAASTSFTAAAVEVGAYATNAFEVTVTDANGATATAEVSASVRNAYTQTIDPYPHCPTIDSLILLENDEEIAVAALRVGQKVWTRHELTLEWGAWPVTAISFHEQPVCSLRGYPDVSPQHRFGLPFRLLPARFRWFRAGWFARSHRMVTVGQITVPGAGTYMVRHPSQRSPWRWSHNIKVTDE